MSIDLMSAVWKESPLEGVHLLLLLSIADMASDEGLCFPSYQTLAKRARISRRYAIDLMGELIEAGIVSRRHRNAETKVNTSNIYILNRANIKNKLLEKPAKTPIPAPVHSEPQFTTLVNPSSLPGEPHITTLVNPISPKSSVNRHLTNSESAQKTRAVCNQSPVWAIAHGEIPGQLSEEDIFAKNQSASLSSLPQDVQPLAEVYMQETRRICADYEKGKWIKAIRQMRQQSITPDVLRDTILDMRQRGVINTWPGSCLNIAAMKVASHRRVELETPAFEIPEYWNNTPHIPAPRKAVSNA